MNKDKPAKEIKDGISEIWKMFDEDNEIVDDSYNNKTIDEVSKKWDMNERILNLFSNNIEKDQKLKEKYAIILITILSIQLIALITIFILKGCNVLIYTDSTFNLFITGGIAEVFVLVGVIVRYLFKDNLTKALNIILENNNKVQYKSAGKKYKKKINSNLTSKG